MVIIYVPEQLINSLLSWKELLILQIMAFVFEICNVFQILCEAGLLPETLLHNICQKFICKNQ
jgi:phosphoribosylformylglycinamidine (FGAM) synthase-like amidotransferase family enzyme